MIERCGVESCQGEVMATLKLTIGVVPLTLELCQSHTRAVMNVSFWADEPFTGPEDLPDD